MSSKSSKLLHLDPVAIALEKRDKAAREIQNKAASTPDNNNLDQSTMSTHSTLGTHSSKSTQSTMGTHSPIAPVRDFMKVANSVSRDAVRGGLFKGKSKQIYDFLYSKTRGSIVPTRCVRLTRREVMLGANIGSTKTLYLNMQHLRGVGLIQWQEMIGPHEGNEYTVNLPEEIQTLGTQSTQSTDSTSSNSSPKVLGVLRVESTMSTYSSSADIATTYENPKTSFKTNTNDDECWRKLREAEREITGKESPSAAWDELFELLASELKTAAARTQSVSSAPAFLTTHLKRQLSRPEKQKPGVVSVGAPQLSVTPQLDRRLTPEEIEEQTQIITELQEGGYTREQVEAQFAGSFHQDDWNLIARRLDSQNSETGK